MTCQCDGTGFVWHDDHTYYDMKGERVTRKNSPSVSPCPSYTDYFKGLVDLEGAVVLAPGEGVCSAAVDQHRRIKERAMRNDGDGRKGRGRF